jgi:hypothetical protein
LKDVGAERGNITRNTKDKPMQKIEQTNLTKNKTAYDKFYNGKKIFT